MAINGYAMGKQWERDLPRCDERKHQLTRCVRVASGGEKKKKKKKKKKLWPRACTMKHKFNTRDLDLDPNEGLEYQRGKGFNEEGLRFWRCVEFLLFLDVEQIQK